jgi:hypothetical protein
MTPKLLKEDEENFSPNHNLHHKIISLLKLVLQARKQPLNDQEFNLLISIFCSSKIMDRKFIF